MPEPTEQNYADALDEEQARLNAGWQCSGCGSTKHLLTIQANGPLSCCPERRLEPPDIACHFVTNEDQLAYVCWDGNQELPTWTWYRPKPLTLSQAQALKDRAEIALGGTLAIVKA